MFHETLSLPEFLSTSLERAERYYLKEDDDPELTHNTLPRFVLGRHLIHMTEDWTTFIRYGFCPIEVTIAALLLHKVSLSYIIQLASQTTFCEDLIQEIRHYSEQDKPTMILQAIVFRLCMHNILHIRLQTGYYINVHTQPELTQKLLFINQLMLDTLLPLCLFMKKTSQYTDEYLLDAKFNPYAILMPAFQQYYPFDNAFVFYGDLPDMTSILPLSSLWYTIKLKYKQNIILALAHLFSKVQSYKCLIRNFMTILHKYIKLYPVLLKYLKLLVQVTLLGNYLHPCTRPSFEARLWIIHSFDILDETDNNNQHFLEWCNQNTELVFFACREKFYHLISTNRLYDDLLNKTTNWSFVKGNIVESCDLIRYTIDQNWHKDDVVYLQELAKNLTELRKMDLKYVLKLRKHNFVNYIFFTITKLVNKSMDPHATTTVTSETILGPELVNLIYRTVTYLEENHLLDNRVPLKWLKGFGISSAGHRKFRSTYIDYEWLDTADYAIAKYVKEEMYGKDPRDCHIILVYFQAIRQIKKSHLIPLPFIYAAHTLQSIRAKFKILPFEPLSPTMTTYYYCPNCGKWAHCLIDPLDGSHASQIYSMAFDHVILAKENDKYILRCGLQKTTILQKRVLNSPELLDPTLTRVEDKSLAHAIQTIKKGSLCSTTPLVGVPLVGYLKQHTKIGYTTLCPLCALPIRMDGAKFGPPSWLHTCMWHKPATDFTNPNDLLPQTSDNPNLTAALRTHILDFYQPQTTTSLCVYCNAPVQDILSPMQKITYVDPATTQPQYIHQGVLCLRDCVFAQSILHEGHISQKSELFRVIHREFSKRTHATYASYAKSVY